MPRNNGHSVIFVEGDNVSLPYRNGGLVQRGEQPSRSAEARCCFLVTNEDDRNFIFVQGQLFLDCALNARQPVLPVDCEDFFGSCQTQKSHRIERELSNFL
jgi:hypothetical protein